MPRVLEGSEGGGRFLVGEVPLYGVSGLSRWTSREREFFIDNLLVRIHLIIEMMLVDRPCTMGV